MRVLEISLRNYRVFEEVDLELPARVIGVFGPNGSGKSTFVESILYGLYGRARTKKEEIRTHGVLTDCRVRLVFEHGGAEYEVRRAIRGKNHVTEAELFAGGSQLAAGVTEVDDEVRRLLRMDQEVFRKSVFAEQKQLDAFSDLTKAKRKEMVLRLLGIKPVDDARAEVRKVARTAEQDAERLAGRLPDPAERERALKEAEGRASEEERAAVEASERLREAEGSAAGAESRFAEIDGAREAAERAEAQRREVAERLRSLDERRGRFDDRMGELRAAIREIPALEEERARLAGARDRVDAARRLGEASEELSEARDRLRHMPPDEAAASTARLNAAETAADEARERAARAAAAAERAAQDLAASEATLSTAGDLDPSAPCPTCGQELGAGFESYVAHCEQEVARFAAARTRAERDARTAEAARARAQKALGAAKRAAQSALQRANERAGLEERVEALESKVQGLAGPFEGRAPDIPQLERQAERARKVERLLGERAADRKHLADTEAELLKVAAEREEAVGRLTALERRAKDLAFDPEEHTKARTERDEAKKLLEEARGREREASDRAKEARAEVKRLEGEVAQIRAITGQVDSLRDEARYLGRVGLLLDGFRTHLYARIVPELSREAEALFRELTNHEYEDLRIHDEDLAIEIADGGAYFPVDRFSGSEADLANLALRVAISSHLSRVAGADVGLMVLDEVLGALDAERKDLMVQTMGRLAGRFHQLFVITHAEQLKDQFPAFIEVQKAGRRRSQAALA